MSECRAVLIGTAVALKRALVELDAGHTDEAKLIMRIEERRAPQARRDARTECPPRTAKGRMNGPLLVITTVLSPTRLNHGDVQRQRCDHRRPL